MSTNIHNGAFYKSQCERETGAEKGEEDTGNAREEFILKKQHGIHNHEVKGEIEIGKTKGIMVIPPQ